jgi:hypothetical protein
MALMGRRQPGPVSHGNGKAPRQSSNARDTSTVGGKAYGRKIYGKEPNMAPVKGRKKANGKAPQPESDLLESQARAIEKSNVTQLSFSPLEAKRAAQTGLAVLTSLLGRLKKQWPTFDFEAVKRLPEVIDRTMVQQRALEQARVASGAFDLSEAFSWRGRLLPLAVSLMRSGHIDEKRVRMIETGTGATDSLQDVVDLVELLQEHAEVARAVVGPGGLEAARTCAQETLSALGRAPGDPMAANEARDLRDRYATLAVRLFDRLRVGVAVATSWKEAEAKVPALSSGRRSAAKKVPSDADSSGTRDPDMPSA